MERQDNRPNQLANELASKSAALRRNWGLPPGIGRRDYAKAAGIWKQLAPLAARNGTVKLPPSTAQAFGLASPKYAGTVGKALQGYRSPLATEALRNHPALRQVSQTRPVLAEMIRNHPAFETLRAQSPYVAKLRNHPALAQRMQTPSPLHEAIRDRLGFAETARKATLANPFRERLAASATLRSTTFADQLAGARAAMDKPSFADVLRTAQRSNPALERRLAVSPSRPEPARPAYDLTRIARAEAQRRQAGIERAEAMLREIIAMRAAVERAEALEREAEERAEAAERREADEAAKGEHRDRLMLIIGGGSAAVSVGSLIAAIIAIA